MAFETCPPDPRLEATIVSYWRLDGLVPGRLYAAAPKRHVELVVNIGAPQLAGQAATGGKAWRSCWVTGLRQTPLFLVPTGTSVLFGARFRDFAFPAWLSGGIARNPAWSTDLEGSPVVARLMRTLSACAGLASAASAFDAFFLAHRSADSQLQSLGRAIASCERVQSLNPASILGRLESSPRRVRMLARNAAGISMRRFARLARFDRALAELGNAPARRLADVAQEVGYFDESHMAH